MRRYSASDEERIRAAVRAREWKRSGLLDERQLATIESELQTDLRRTKRSLRVVLFIFGTVVVWAGIGFYLAVFGVSRTESVARLVVMAGIAWLLLADYLVAKFRLYRFGVEEAFASWSAVMVAVAVGVLVSLGPAPRGEFPMLAGLLTGTVAFVAVYMRFGYLYAALGAVVAAGLVPFNLGASRAVERLLSSCVLLAIFVLARSHRRAYGEDFPGDDYGTIESAAWLGVYIVLNLRLSSDLFFSEAFRPAFPTVFYWGTYVATWLLPAAGLCLGLRSKHREFIGANLLMAIATLVTNKPYLGLKRHTWDPVLLGVLLTGTAIAIRYWLSRGRDGLRHGFTATRLLTSDRELLDALSSMGATVQPFEARVRHAETPPFEPGRGGRSGGGGGGADF